MTEKPTINPQNQKGCCTLCGITATMYKIDNIVYCADCIDAKFFNCDCCSHPTKKTAKQTVNDNQCCAICFNHSKFDEDDTDIDNAIASITEALDFLETKISSQAFTAIEQKRFDNIINYHNSVCFDCLNNDYETCQECQHFEHSPHAKRSINEN